MAFFIVQIKANCLKNDIIKLKVGENMIVRNKEVIKLSKIRNSFYEDLKIEFLYHSNHIEGSTFSKENLAKLLYEKKVQGTHFYDDVIETRNSLDVFDKVIESIDEELNKFLLFDWHRTLKKGTVDEEIQNTGRWKLYENRLKNVDLKVALPHAVDSMMFNLVMNWNETENKTLMDVAQFHAEFELIHPFQDGNGRIGRFIILKQCINSGIDLIAIDKMYEAEYKEALYHAQVSKDYEPLANVFKKCQDRLDEKMLPYKNLIETIHQEFEETEEIEKEEEMEIC